MNLYLSNICYNKTNPCQKIGFENDLEVIFGHLRPEMEFNEFKPRFKSAKTRFKFSAGLNLETFDTIFSGTNHI